MELLVTVAIVTVVTSIALPSYKNHVIRSHRGDAMAALLRVANAQEKFYLQNNTYTDDLADLNIDGTDHGYYDLAITAADVNGFTATAETANGGPQEDDDACNRYQIDSTGARSASDGGGGDNTTYCWR
jgi:type IV pilus assembly protein PilE